VGITQEVGTTFNLANQAGMSAVLLSQSSTANAKQLRQLFPSRTYESSMIEALVTKKLPLRWALTVNKTIPRLWLGATPAVQCGSVAYTGFVSKLPDPGEPLYADPSRFYVLEVAKIVLNDPSSGADAEVTDAPKYVVVTLGVPTVQVPPGSSLAAAVTAARPGAPLGLTIDFAGGPRLTLRADQCFWGAGKSLYTVMTESVATAFSTSNAVMTIGAMAFMDCFLVFDIAAQRLGLLERPHSV